MSAFLKHAEEILETARQNSREDCRISILVGRDGGVHMVMGSDWELEPLRIHYGAEAAYRVTREAGNVQLEGRSDEGVCRLSAGAARPMLFPADFPQYQIA